MKICIKFSFIACFLVHNSASLHSQSIQIINKSFEGFPGAGSSDSKIFQLTGWNDNGDSLMSPPDIHPCKVWNVTQKPSDGSTYLGMVVRDNNTTEKVYQHLSSPLKKGRLYQFTIDLCQSLAYESRSIISNRQTNYMIPACLGVDGITGAGDMVQNLYTTEAVTNKEWQKYTIRFIAKQDIDYLMLSAAYEEPCVEAYGGHILLDNMSDIEPITCNLKESGPSLKELIFGNKIITMDTLRQYGYWVTYKRYGAIRHSIYSKGKNHFYFLNDEKGIPMLYKVILGSEDGLLQGQIQIGASPSSVENCVTENEVINGESYLSSSTELGKISWDNGKISRIYGSWSY